MGYFLEAVIQDCPYSFIVLQVHLPLSGYKRQTTLTGSIDATLMPKPLMKPINGPHNHIPRSSSWNPSHCTEHHLTLNNSSSNSTHMNHKTYTITIPVNQFLFQNHHLLHIHPLVADLSMPRLMARPTILILHNTLVVKCQFLHPIFHHSQMLSFN